MLSKSSMANELIMNSFGNVRMAQKRKGYARHGMFQLMFDMFVKCFVNLRHHGKTASFRRFGVSTSAVFMLMVFGATDFGEFNNNFITS